MTPDPGQHAAPRPQFRAVLLAVLATRLAVAVVLMVLELLQPTPLPDGRYTHEVAEVSSLAGQLLVKWDSYWYLQIAEFGYDPQHNQGVQSGTAFAPLYPLMMAGLARTGLPAWVGGALLSAGCFLLLMWLLFRLGAALHSPWLGAGLMWLVSAFPSAWVLHMVYAESMFCACLAGVFWFHHRRSYWAAGVCALLLPQIRVVGLVMWPALGADWVCDSLRRRGAAPSWPAVLCSTLGVIGFGVVGQHFAGDWDAMLVAGQAWFGAAGAAGSWMPLVHSIREQVVASPVAMFATAALVVYGIAATLLLIRRQGLGAWFAVLYLVVLLRTPFVSTQLRYLLPLLPVHAYLLESLRGRCRPAPLIAGLLVVQIVLSRWALQWLLIL